MALRRSFAALLASAVLFPGAAHADGGPPIANRILFEPGNSRHIVIQSEYWGLFDSRDGGDSWTYLCSEAFGGKALVKETTGYVIAPGGRILAPAGRDGVRVADDACDVHTIAVEGLYVQALAFADPESKQLLALASSPMDGGLEARLAISTDRGDSWSTLGAKMPDGFAGDGLVAAPSDPMRLYVVGNLPGDRNMHVVRTGDRGASWSLETTTFIVDVGTPVSFAGVHPTRPDVALVRVDQYGTTPDELWLTPDAGHTWTQAFTGKGDLTGFVFSGDGTRVFVAGPDDGILEASVDDLLGGRAGAFQRVYDGKAWGLARSGDRMFAGTDDYGMKPHFMMGVSIDGARSFESVMTRCEVTLPACAPGTASEMVCRTQWERQGGYVTDILDVNPCRRELHGEPDAGEAPSADAGAPPPVRKRGNDEGCAVVRFGPSSTKDISALAVMLAALLQQRRRYRLGPRSVLP